MVANNFYGQPVWFSLLTTLFLLYLLQIFDTADRKLLTSFVTLDFGSPSWMSFTIPFIVSIDSSFLGAMFPFNYLHLITCWSQQELFFNCKLIWISMLVQIFAFRMQITSSYLITMLYLFCFILQKRAVTGIGMDS